MLTFLTRKLTRTSHAQAELDLNLELGDLSGSPFPTLCTSSVSTLSPRTGCPSST